MSSTLAKILLPPVPARQGGEDQRLRACRDAERDPRQPSEEPAPAADSSERHSSGIVPKSGARLCFEHVYDGYFDFVWRSVRRLGVDAAAAEDVTQEVFVTVHRRLHTFEGRSSLKTWLFGVALGIVRNHRRAAKRRRDGLSATAVALRLHADGKTDSEHPHARAERAEAVRILYSILAQLDDDKREVFILMELEQLRAAEVAEVLASNVNTVFSRLRAARSQFKQAATRYRARERWRNV